MLCDHRVVLFYESASTERVHIPMGDDDPQRMPTSTLIHCYCTKIYMILNTPTADSAHTHTISKITKKFDNKIVVILLAVQEDRCFSFFS